MKKKNGFTLIELLAVIVILAIILAIVLPKIFNNISNSTEQFYKEQESILKEATLKYLNNEYIDSNTSVITITKEDLINAGYISEIYDVNNGNSVCDATIIVYSLSSNPKIKVLLSCENYNSDGVDETYLVVNLNEGSTSQIFEEKYTYGTKITLINPTKVGYTFTGWTVEGEGASLSENILTIGTSVTMITANWERNYVTLTVNLNEGATTQSFNEEYELGSNITLINPTKVGYTFTGWTVEGEGASLSENILTIGTSATTITANWKRNYVTLTVNLNEGSTTQSFEETYYSFSTLSLTNPTKAGYTFTGWTVEGTGASINGTELTIGTSATTITANWEINNPVYSYSCSNGSVGTSPYYIVYTGKCTVIDDGNDNWRVEFLTSGTLTLSKAVKVDIHAVGGGGSGAARGLTNYGSGGGGGGYVNTIFATDVASGEYDITIGAGGNSVTSTGGAYTGVDGIDGGSSSFGSICSAAGGKGGTYNDGSAVYSCGIGGAGGSGGGGGAKASGGIGGSGGTNGGNGEEGSTTDSGAGGTGSGVTTRDFGETTGTLRSGGGAGSGRSAGGIAGDSTAGDGAKAGTAGSGIANYGGGGGGAGGSSSSDSGCTSGAGGSGIVIIRNAR